MRVNSVQFLRAFAALAVVSGHAMATAQRIGPFNRPQIPTGAGVDLFFAISGFIMVYSSEKLFGQAGAIGTFLYRRVCRIAPLYWIATTTYLGLLALAAMQGKEFPGIVAIISSYLFVPNADFGAVDGIPFPVLSLGWSLNYEMLFYLIFAVFIFLAREKCVAGVLAVLCAGVCLGLLFSPANVMIQFWTQPITLEFALGMIVGLAFRRGFALPAYARIAAIVIGFVWFAMDVGGLHHLAQTPNDFRRVFGYGAPAALILASIVLGPDPLPARFEKPAAVLGDASYSLYLTHPFIYVALQRMWPKIAGVHHLWMMVGIGVVLAVALSIAVNKWIEKPLLGLLHRPKAPGGGQPSTAAI